MKKLLWAISVIPLTISLIILPIIPDTIPAHYNSAWEIDRWGSKYELLIIPIMTILFTLIISLIIVYLKKKSVKPCGKIPKTSMQIVQGLTIAGIYMAIVFGIMQLIFLYTSYTGAGL